MHRKVQLLTNEKSFVLISQAVTYLSQVTNTMWLKHTLDLSIVVSCVCELILLFSVVFYLVRSVQIFGFRLTTDWTPDKWWQWETDSRFCFWCDLDQGWSNLRLRSARRSRQFCGLYQNLLFTSVQTTAFRLTAFFWITLAVRRRFLPHEDNQIKDTKTLDQLKFNPLNTKAQTAVFKDPVRTAL